MARFPDLGPFVMALVTQMGGRATERRDSDQICIKSTYRVIASIVSARFGEPISARWVCKHIRKHAQRQGLPESFPISTRCIQRTLLPTESEQPNAWMLNHAMHSLLVSAYVNVAWIVCCGRDDHATISGGVVTDGRMVQVRAAQVPPSPFFLAYHGRCCRSLSRRSSRPILTRARMRSCTLQADPQRRPPSRRMTPATTRRGNELSSRCT